MMEHMGGSYTFRMFGIAALILFLVHVIVQKLIVKYTSGKNEHGDEDMGERKDTVQNDLNIIEVTIPLSQQTNLN